MVELRNINIEVDEDDVLDGLQSDLTLEKVINRWMDEEEKDEALEYMISDADPEDVLLSLQSKYTLRQVIEKWPETGKAEDNKPASIVNLTTEEILNYLNESGLNFADIVSSWPDVDDVVKQMDRQQDANPLEQLRKALERVFEEESVRMDQITLEIGKVFSLTKLVRNWSDDDEKGDAILTMLSDLLKR